MEYKIRTLLPEEIPSQLFEIPEPPKQLHIVGSLPPQENIYLSVVGSRKYTSYGKDVCNTLIEGLRGYPITIVSGLALGMDGIAHEAAIRAGLHTIAFPGSGLSEKVLYPRSHVGLAHAILKNGGALISEYENDFRATIWGFPRRNRLVAGIARAVLIIEAGKKSGALITSRLATEYNRDVLAVPGSIFSDSSEGTNWLIRQGATPITKSEDILLALGFDIAPSFESQAKLPLDCSPQEIAILEFLTEPRTRDDLVESVDKPIHEINTLLSVLEIKGLIKEEMGEIRRV